MPKALSRIMSRCPYCRRELSGLETLCQSCFAKGYEQVLHPKPWWQRRELWHRPRVTWNIFYGFLLVFGYGFLRLQIGLFHRWTIKNSALFALVFALIVAFVESTRKNPSTGTK